MESADLGKLFIGGISWDTNEDRLRDYFNSFGEVVEAVIMKDRTTGRARGFGFVVFADPAVAERVVMEKHTIDGRMVEAKKAVPRDDPHIINRSNSSNNGSPGPGRTKKIFVGGLPSTITESEFKNYFDQFGMITDVVVMYDHNTQRPRGFGFITYDSEDAVDKVLLKTFHELNGKMVEVKRAVPKELSPGPSMRSPIGGYNNYGINRVNSFLNGYTQGYNSSLMGSYGMRMDGRLGTVAGGRSGFPAFGPGFGLGMNIESSLTPNFGGTSSYNNNSFGYGRNLSPSYYSGSSGRYNSPIGLAGGNSNVSSVPSSMSRNIWDNGFPNYIANPSNSSALGGGNLSSFGNNTLNWGSSSLSVPIGGSSSSYGGGNLGYADVQNNFGLDNSSFGRSIDPGLGNNSLVSSRSYEGSLSELYAGSSVYGDPTWQSSTSELEGSDPMGYGIGNAAQDLTSKSSAGYMGGYMLPLGNQIEKDEVLAGMLSVRCIHKPNGAS